MSLPFSTVDQVVRMLGLSPRAMRFYEEIGLVKAGRNHRNCRIYDELAYSRLRRISELRAVGLGLKDVAEVLAAEEERPDSDACLTEKLLARLDHLRSELRTVEAMIERLPGSGAPCPPSGRRASSATEASPREWRSS